MCAGGNIPFRDINKEELKDFYSRKEIKTFEDTGKVSMFFWQPKPVLPIKLKDGIHLMTWGNRDDKESRFPRTGWARRESIEDGKWNWLHPMGVIIPLTEGYEKKIWFDIDGGLKGVVAELDGEQRVYMVTKPPTQAYEKATGHDRMPLGKFSHFRAAVNN